jgi:peptidoglycan/LPS O-acetylase OafA/YrhL
MNQSQPAPHSPRSEYLPWIDGLRAIAVLAVMLYHLRNEWLPGGFAGVDVFFVISGFVVSASVARWDRGGLGSFLMYFYARRIQRIAPALIACLLVTTVVSCLFIPNAWLSSAVDRTGLFAFIGMSNLFLAFQNENYFAPSAEFNPYVHTWSLGVEEQFYLLFPLLFFAWTRSSRGRVMSLAYCLAAALVASLVDAWWRSTSNPAAAFYLITTRFWELAAGVLMFQLLHRKWKRRRSIHRGFAFPRLHCWPVLRLSCWAGRCGPPMRKPFRIRRP